MNYILKKYYKTYKSEPKTIQKMKMDILIDDLTVMGKAGRINKIYLYLRIDGDFVLLTKPNQKKVTFRPDITGKERFSPVSYVGEIKPQRTKKANKEIVLELLGRI